MNKTSHSKSPHKTPNKKSSLSSTNLNENQKTSTKKKNNKENLTKQNSWTSQEDKKMIELINTRKYTNWKLISEQFPGHSQSQCISHWNKILKPGIIKGPWRAEEDKILMDWVKKNGAKNWTKCCEVVKGRSGKQCREHWNNSLNPEVKKGKWTTEEDFLIMYFYKKYDGSWKKIINLFEGRTENSIKNRFFSQLRKIAANKLKLDEKRFCSKIKLETLLNYLDIATIDAKKNYLVEKPQNEDELLKYLSSLEQKIIKAKNKNKKKSKTKENQENIINNDNNEKNLSTINIENNKAKFTKKFLKKRNRDVEKSPEEKPQEKNLPINDIKNKNIELNIKTQIKSIEINNDINQINQITPFTPINTDQTPQNFFRDVKKQYTINRNIPISAEEEVLVPQISIPKFNGNYNNNVITPTSFNFPSYSSINNNQSIFDNHNSSMMSQNNLGIYAKEPSCIFSSFKVDGQTRPFVNPCFSNVNPLISKPSISKVEGCSVIDNEIELNNSGIERKATKKKFEY